MKRAYVLLAAAAIFASAACDAKKGNDTAANSSAPITPVAAPKGGDLTKMVTQTPEGGFLMGNPNADVKLVEYGSMTCPHCAEFAEKDAPKIVQGFVKTGRVSFEFRNFVRDGLDVAMSLIARCGGPDRFFPLTDALFKSQREIFERAQSAPAAQQESLSQSPQGYAQLAGLQQWAAQRGLPSAKSNACLTDQAGADRLVQIRSEADSNYRIPGTPTFLINGKVVEIENGTPLVDQLEAKLRDALGERG
jgi:protein-disulfide isomerase